ncbi:MAG: DNRLRE domain-containing protein [Maribacter sp.]|uniref:CBM96 family carbohydrate-binding protein n=1 Tax=Maribacter sp. TaxID=1897614 RepID=UPI003299FB20
MKSIPQKVVHLAMLSIFIFFLFSCSKDTDLLLDSVLNDPGVSVEEKNGTQEVPADEEGFVFRTFTFSATNDAYIQDDAGHDKSIVRLQEDYRTSYLMFDLSEINGPITNAVLQFSIDSDEGDGSIAIHKGQDTEWSEENLTINNAPGLQNQLASINKEYKVGSPEKVTLDATNLKAEITSLVMVHSTGNDLAFASKEHPDNKGPKLTVTYKAPEGSPLIEQQEEEEEEEDTNQEDDTNQEEDQNNTASTEGAYYVTTSGKSSNNGLSEATAWNIEEAFDRAVAGDVVYIKAGNYGSKELVVDNSGTASKPIKFIGYTNSPGDLVSTEGSTFNYGDQLDLNKMPLIYGNSNLEKIGLSIPENYIEIENLQISNYWIGVFARGNNVSIKNIISTNLGEQEFDNSQTGKGFQIYGNQSLIENCFILNANSEGINIKGADNCLVKNCKVFSDNTKNMTGYYILLSEGATNNTIEGCELYRNPAGDATIKPHQGHGYVLKDRATNNTVRNSKATNTGIEANFSGVYDNTFENIEIVGSFSTYPGQYSPSIRVLNGSHDNLFQNISVVDSPYGIAFVDFDDGFEGAGGDRDKKEGGHNNKFINIQVDKAKNCVAGTSAEVGAAAFSNNNEFVNCSFNDITGVPLFSRQTIRDTQFINCSFSNIASSTLTQGFAGGSFSASFKDCSFTNVGFAEPSQ